MRGGRRLGLRRAAVASQGAPPTSVILATAPSVAEGAEDPIYGDSMQLTWAALQGRALDFGHLPGTLDDLLVAGALVARPRRQRRGRHGGVARRPHRGDVPGGRHIRVGRPHAMLSAIRIAAGETMAVSSHAVKAWLANLVAGGGGSSTDGAATLGDVAVGSLDLEDGRRGRVRPIAPVAVIQDDRVGVARAAGGVRPGATIVVPASYGGITDGSWDPTACAFPLPSGRGLVEALLGGGWTRWSGCLSPSCTKTPR